MFNIEKIPGIASIYGVPWTSRLLGLILAGLFGSVFLGVTRFLGVQGLYVSVGLFFTGAAFGYIAWMLSCRIPRNKPGMIGIALAIKTETQEEQRRIRADFIQEIGRCLGKNESAHPFYVYEIPGHLAPDINDIEGAFSTGDSVYVSATSSALWDAEDEEGDQITLNHDVTGSVITFRSTGVMVTAGDMTQTVQANADATTDDQGVYSITFDVEAFEDTAYILLGSATRGGSSTTTAANYYVESSTNSYAATTTGSVSSEVTRVSGGSVEGSYVRINAGSKATFKLSVYFDAALTDLYRLQLQSVNFNDTAAAPDSSEAVTPLEDFQTTSVSVQN